MLRSKDLILDLLGLWARRSATIIAIKVRWGTTGRLHGARGAGTRLNSLGAAPQALCALLLVVRRSSISPREVIVGNSLIAQSETLPGLLPDEDAMRLAESLARTISADDRGRPCMDRLPTVVERQMLDRRRADVIMALDGINMGGPGEGRARSALAALFAGYSSLQNANTLQMLDTYLGWLGDLPDFAIVEACALIGRGKAQIIDPATEKPQSVGLRFPPTPAEMHVLASPFAKRRWDEVLLIERVLRVKEITPRPVSDAERARVAEKIADLAASMKVPLERERDERSAARAQQTAAGGQQSIAAQWRAEGYEPMFKPDGSIQSPSLLRSVGRWPPDDAVKLSEA
jgi:hypothetical protein